MDPGPQRAGAPVDAGPLMPPGSSSDPGEPLSEPSLANGNKVLNIHSSAYLDHGPMLTPKAPPIAEPPPGGRSPKAPAPDAAIQLPHQEITQMSGPPMGDAPTAATGATSDISSTDTAATDTAASNTAASNTAASPDTAATDSSAEDRLPPDDRLLATPEEALAHAGKTETVAPPRTQDPPTRDALVSPPHAPDTSAPGKGTSGKSAPLMPPPPSYSALVGGAVPGDPTATYGSLLGQRLRALLPWQTTDEDDPIAPLLRAHKMIHPSGDMTLLRRAYGIAEQMHRGQMRKSGEPFISHPLTVAQILADLGMDTTTLVAALLHDTVEDTSYTLGALERDFGSEVALLVDGVTKFDKVFYGADAETETIRKMIVSAGRDVRVLVIKLADRLHNMRTLDARSHSSQVRIATATREVLIPLCERLGIQALKRELEDWVLRAVNPGGYALIADYVAHREGWDEYLVKVTDVVEAELQQVQDRRDRVAAPPAPVLDLERHGQRQLHRPVRPAPRRDHRRRSGHRLLRRARRRAQPMAADAGPVQGLHRLAEEQPLPLVAHHGARPGPEVGRGAHPDRGDAPVRRVRHRRQLPLSPARRPVRRRGAGRAARLAAPPPGLGDRRGRSGPVHRVAALRPGRRPDPRLHLDRAADPAAGGGHPGRPRLRAGRGHRQPMYRRDASTAG